MEGQFSHFKVTQTNNIAHVEVNRPSKANAFNETTWNQYYQLIQHLSENTDTRVIVLSGVSKNFSAGIDLTAISPALASQPEKFYAFIKHFQKCINAPIEFNIPVISVSHGVCYGLGLDIISATTIRIASADTRFSIKEIDIGIIADIGSLQRLPVIMGNISKLNEWALTGREFSAKEALQFGVVSDVLDSKDSAIDKAFEIARAICSKYGDAVKGTKKNLEFATIDNLIVQKGLDQVALDNSELMSKKSYWKFFMLKYGARFGAKPKLETKL